MATQSENNGTVILVWNRAICDEGISHYRIYLDDKVIANTTSDSNIIKISNMPFNVDLTFQVLAVTRRCRVSRKSDKATVLLTDTDKVKTLNYTLDFFI